MSAATTTAGETPLEHLGYPPWSKKKAATWLSFVINDFGGVPSSAVHHSYAITITA